MPNIIPRLDAPNKACCGGTGCGRTVAYQGDITQRFERRCIGSDCMAWRFAVEEDDTGYCGLAGAPPA